MELPPNPTIKSHQHLKPSLPKESNGKDDDIHENPANSPFFGPLIGHSSLRKARLSRRQFPYRGQAFCDR